MNGLATKIQANFKLSLTLAAATAAINILANLFLVGWLVRVEGFSALGVWSFLNAIALVCGILDFGIMTGASRDIAQEEGRDSYFRIARLARLSERFIFLGAVCLMLSTQALPLGHLVPAILAALAGLFQVVAGWWIAIPLGEHKHYWFSVKVSLRMVVQLSAVLFFVSATPENLGVALALALLIGSLAELILARSVALTIYKPESRNVDRIALSKLVDLSREFGLLNLIERTREPVMRFVIYSAAGTVGLGQFTAAFRLNAALQAIFTQAMRSTLPGFAALKMEQEAHAAQRITQAAFFFQLFVSVPCFLFLICFLPNLIRLWLGEADPTVVIAGRWIGLGMCFNCLAAPSFFQLQAIGSAKVVSRYSLLGLIAFSIGGLLIYYYSSDPVGEFALLFAVTQFFIMSALLISSGRKIGILEILLNQTRKLRLVATIILSSLLIFLLNFANETSAADVENLVVALLAFLGLYLLPVTYLLRRRSFVASSV